MFGKHSTYCKHTMIKAKIAASKVLHTLYTAFKYAKHSRKQTAKRHPLTMYADIKIRCNISPC